MNGQTWHDWGFDNFMTRTIPSSNRLSSIGARNLIPIGGISPSRLVSPLNATTDIVFSSTDNDTAAWASGTIYFADGTNSGTIDSGNTGNISATTYVYYDREILGVLQTTTTVSNATGVNKLLIAIVEEGASGKDCKITPTIAAGLNVSGITANQISVNQLDALAVNTGTLTVDESITAGGSTDGTIYVKDSSNNTKVQLDQDGITINTGKMTIKDDAETTVIDAKGLVGTAAFASADTVSGVINQVINTTTRTDITDASLSIVLTRNTPVLLLADVHLYVAGVFAGAADWAGYANVRFKINDDEKAWGTTAWGAWYNTLEDSSGAGGEDQFVVTPTSIHHVETLGVGTNVVKLQGFRTVTTGACWMVVYKYKFSYVVLGK